MANEKHRQQHPWEGSLVDGVFRLEEHLGEGAQSSVFRTDYSRRQAVIKLLPPESATADWSAAARLNHPALVRILASGRDEVQGTPVAYIVTEYADETMQQVLAERPLTPTEARDVLATVLDALAYLHSQGFVHGHITPSNFLAVGDKLKLSIDGARAGGDPGEDVRMLGAVFDAALAKPLPQPFLDITRHALDPDPRERWTVAEIATRLNGRMPVRDVEPEHRAIWRIVAPIAIILIAAIAWMVSRLPPRPKPASAVPPPVAQPVPRPSPAPAVKVETPPETPPKTAPKAAPERARRRSKSESPAPAAGIVSQPMPEVIPEAVRTIRGKVTIPVRVDVDASGSVTGASLASRTGSRYFAQASLKAARRWKFTPTGEPQVWTLRFEFTRQNTRVFPARGRP